MSDLDPGSLACVGLLKDLSASELVTASRNCAWKNYAAREQIIDRQSETTDVFFVIQGTVRVVNYSASGREITLDDVNTGGHFGELAAIDERPRSASVMALTSCHLAVMGQDRFIEFVKRHPNMALRVMRDLARVVRNATDRIMDLSTLAANNRVQADLVRLASSNMTEDGQSFITPIPIHGDLASRVSTTRETVARVMNNLAREGIVERRKDALVIKDVAKLRSLVEQVRGE